MKSYCELIIEGETQRCPKCGIVFNTLDKIRSVCDPERQERKRKVKQNGGVGTELKKILKTFGIVATPNCSCNKRANYLDHAGIEYCENNIEMIVDFMEEEAKKRKLLFSRLAAKILVNRAIKNAKKNDAPN